MEQSLDDIIENAKSNISQASDLKALDECRVQFLGKKGVLTEFLKTLGQLPADERPIVGQQVNNAKELVQELIKSRFTELNQQQIEAKLAASAIDVSLPGRKMPLGSLHPITQTIQTLKQIFTRMGFNFTDGPEIEDDYHNFTALNIPPLHPARAMQDTFYLQDGNLLRSQTSTVQIRAMNHMQPPLRIVAMGRVYRRDFDITHTPMFHQMECLMVDKKITFGDLKGLLHHFLSEFFATDIAMRFRPSYFPFTEPSAEVDITCLGCGGEGCRICKFSGWLEILGCGMVHPNVLNEVNIDSSHYSGFAFGLGIDRITLLKYNIPDLRALFENDIRFLKQF